jgi:hypothetical protein
MQEAIALRRKLVWSAIFLIAIMLLLPTVSAQEVDPHPFGQDFPDLDSLYTLESGVLKLTAQLYPLLADESREVTLELDRGRGWVFAARESVVYPGWSAHFRIDQWDDSKDVPFRLSHPAGATWAGLIRRNPVDKDVIVVANMSCNSSRTPGPRETIVANLKAIDPDLLFFAGDQTYRHTQHTQGWLEFGTQFGELMRDRPTITIPDDHDVGHPNLWGASGKKAASPQGPDGGYYYPVEYVRMVERCQTWHLPDPVDPEPVQRGIGVWFTRLRLGGVNFAILEDRKFKSAPVGNIQQQGPRPDHITDAGFDLASVDLPGLELLGARQLRFLNQWGQDWQGAAIKCVLSQTAFCGAVHLHGERENRLLADLDCNGWPQSGRNAALRELRRCRALHLCGDQHLAVVVKHGIESPGDGPFAFISPALVNTVYGRWWHPENEMEGDNPVSGSPLPWTGDYRDGLGNYIRMMAYANPGNLSDERQRGDGFGIARFRKSDNTVTIECWPRFAESVTNPANQYPGWPLTLDLRENDGRKPTGWLPTLQFDVLKSPVVQILDETTGEIVTTFRSRGSRVELPVFSDGPFLIKAGRDRADEVIERGLKPAHSVSEAGERQLRFQ